MCHNIKGSEVAEKTKLILTNRELEILKLITDGLSNQKKNSDKLHIIVRTVEAHKNNIMEKLELITIIDVVKFAIKNKIIDL